jgi:DNA adenine methylase
MSTLFDTGPTMKITALAPWFGSNRMLGEHVGAELRGCEWVGIPFSGGMAEVPHITARGLLVNDLHRDIINLARCTRDDESRQWLKEQADARVFHPDELAAAQEACKSGSRFDRQRALDYFVAVWMGRSGKAGTDEEFKGNLSARFTASGGGSAKRYRSAVESLEAWGHTLKRCEFSTLDFREFLGECHDRPKHGIYCDPPFPGAGEAYRHKFSERDHRDLAKLLNKFQRARVVVRYYADPLVAELYPRDRWTWRELRGRDQANNAGKPEVLLINGPSYAEGT